MRQIADCLQIKAPSLYHHFASKEDLARQALTQYRGKQASRLHEIAASGGLSEKLQAYAELFAEMLRDGERLCMYLAMVRESSFQDDYCADELRLFARQNIDWLVDILKQGKTSLRSQLVMAERDLAEIIFASFEGIMAISLSDKRPSIAFRKRANNFLSLIVKSAI